MGDGVGRADGARASPSFRLAGHCGQEVRGKDVRGKRASSAGERTFRLERMIRGRLGVT